MALRAAQAELGRQAASDERRRIAREIHDIVAHSLTVTMLHLTGARYILARDPEGAAAALVEAERPGRQSLADVWRTVGLLEAEGDPRVRSLTPTPLPGAEDIATLVRDYAQAGLDAHYTGTGPVARVSAAAGLALYRITQEALANVVKHAAGAHVNVELRTESDVHLRVSDDGKPDLTGSGARMDAASRLGVAGMRERAVLLGGTLSAGPTSYPLFRSCSRRTGSRAYFSTITTLGTPQDAMLQEVRVESFFSADDATAQRTWINAD
jgi:signal transduction histidine kinase